ncbi:MAG: 50S ribosomal protein L11 methyltransferase [Anaerolineales bacterium]|nr:50S ribosomal protein L11 methyltransferase [Anaerolineales bacterium]
MQILFGALAVFIIMIALLWVLVPAIYGLPPVSSRDERIRRALELANPRAGETLYDLGSGHGRVLIMAAKEFGLNAVGIEAGPVQCAVSWINALRNGVSSNVHVEAGNFYKSNLKDADIVFAYLTSDHGNRLQEKLGRELKPGARVVTVSFELPGWNIDFFDREQLIYLYKK